MPITTRKLKAIWTVGSLGECSYCGKEELVTTDSNLESSFDYIHSFCQELAPYGYKPMQLSSIDSSSLIGRVLEYNNKHPNYPYPGFIFKYHMSKAGYVPSLVYYREIILTLELYFDTMLDLFENDRCDLKEILFDLLSSEENSSICQSIYALSGMPAVIKYLTKLNPAFDDSEL